MRQVAPDRFSTERKCSGRVTCPGIRPRPRHRGSRPPGPCEPTDPAESCGDPQAHHGSPRL